MSRVQDEQIGIKLLRVKVYVEETGLRSFVICHECNYLLMLLKSAKITLVCFMFKSNQAYKSGNYVVNPDIGMPYEVDGCNYFMIILHIFSA